MTEAQKAAAAEAKREYQRQWQRDHKEQVRAYNRAWAEKNPEKVKQYRDRWRKENPDKVKESQLKYWAKKAGAMDPAEE